MRERDHWLMVKAREQGVSFGAGEEEATRRVDKRERRKRKREGKRKRERIILAGLTGLLLHKMHN